MALPQVDASLDEIRSAWMSSFLGTLPDRLSDRLFEESRIEEAAPGDLVLRGTEASCFVIVKGVVRIYLQGQDGRQATIRYAADGEAAGLPPVVADRMEVWGDAVTDVQLIRLPAHLFKTLAQREASLAWATACHLAEMMTNSNETLGADIFLPVRARVARHLLDLAEREPHGLVVHARHQQIANAIGSVREVVSREMRRFAEEGLIKRVGDTTLLVDSAELHRIASGG